MIYCVHEIDARICSEINQINSYDIITFDDALYSQFLYRDKIISKNRIYFICPSLINNDDINESFVTCRDAMSRHFNFNSNEYYMKIDNIKNLMDYGYKIGAHSYQHRHLKYEKKYGNKTKSLLSKIKGSLLCIKDYDYIKDDTEKLLEWFSNNLGIVPTSYCFPFNQSTDKLISILESFGFKEFYGGERESIC